MNQNKISGNFICFSLALLVCVLGVPSHAQAVTEQAVKSNKAATSTAEINIIFEGSWDPAAQAAMEYAANIWETAIYSPIPIEIEVSWYTDEYDGLANAYGDLVSHSSQLPIYIAAYPIPLVSAIRGIDYYGDDPDFTIVFNDYFTWYFGTDGQTPASSYDFVTGAIRYIGRGLGLKSLMRQCFTDNYGCFNSISNEIKTVYDMSIENSSGVPLSSFPHFSQELGNQLTSNQIYFGGQEAIAANGGNRPKLLAPEEWQAGVDELLLDDSVFPRGSINSLMTGVIEMGEAIHDPGPIAKAMLYDLGWPKPLQPPILSHLPSQLILVNTNHNHAIDLHQYVYDGDTSVDQLTFTLVSTTSIQIGVTLDNGRYIDINPDPDWLGMGTVTIEVEDATGLTDTQTFNVYVVEQIYTTFLPFLSDS